MPEKLFLALDGDDIGRLLEFHIVSDDEEGLRRFTESFLRVTDKLTRLITKYPQTDVILHGGDSLLISLNPERLEGAISCVTQATKGTGFTFSGGYGTSMKEAYLALKVAKASGKNKIISLGSKLEPA